MKDIQKNWLEWTVFAFGLVLTLGTLGILGWDAITSKGTPPRVEVQLGTPQRLVIGKEEQFLVSVTAINHGDETAEGVHLEVSLERAAKEPELGDLEFAYLPRNSRREGSVTFHTDPRTGQLKSRVLGYERN